MIPTDVVALLQDCLATCSVAVMAWWNVKMIRRSSHKQMTLRMLLSMITDTDIDMIIITYMSVNLFQLAFYNL